MNSLIVVLIIIWLYVMSVLKRGKIHFWYFCLGSAGLFIFLMVLLEPLLVETLAKTVTFISGVIGEVTGLYQSSFEHSIIFIERPEQVISLYVDFECSGVIEILAFTALLWFFPVYTWYEKILVNIVGILTIFFGNVIRIFSIIMVVQVGGSKSYYIAHTLIGRFIFYGISIALYYVVFTKSQIIRQKVGDFKYDSQ